jgi:hypothetical protein
MLSKAGARRHVLRKLAGFLTKAYSVQELKLTDAGNILSHEDFLLAEEAYKTILEGMQASGKEAVTCYFKGCRYPVSADAFLCRAHWQFIPENLRDLYLEEHQKVKGDKAFLSTARAYIELAAEKRHKNDR